MADVNLDAVKTTANTALHEASQAAGCGGLMVLVCIFAFIAAHAIGQGGHLGIHLGNLSQPPSRGRPSPGQRHAFVGDDLFGQEVFYPLRRFCLRTDGLTIDPNVPTGTVGVALDSQAKPTFAIQEDVAWDFIEASEQILDVASRADAICFGSLAQRNAASRAAIRAVLAAALQTDYAF